MQTVQCNEYWQPCDISGRGVCYTGRNELNFVPRAMKAVKWIIWIFNAIKGLGLNNCTKNNTRGSSVKYYISNVISWLLCNYKWFYHRSNLGGFTNSVLISFISSFSFSTPSSLSLPSISYFLVLEEEAVLMSMSLKSYWEVWHLQAQRM